MFAQRFIAVLLFGIGSTSGLLAQSSPTYPEVFLPELDQILDQARERAPALVAQAIAQQEATARLDAAKAAYYPRLDFGGNFGVTQSSYLDGNYPDEQTTGIAFNARVTRPIYHWGAIEAKIRQARLDFNNESLQRVFILRQIKRGLRADYLTLLLNQTSLEILRLRRQITADNATRTASDRQQGALSSMASEQAEINLAQDVLNLEQVDSDQTRIVADFKRNLGWDVPLRIDVPPPRPDSVALIAWAEQTRAQGLDAWLADHAEVKRRENLIKRERAELIRIKAAQRPLLNFTASIGQGQRNTSAANNVSTLSTFIGIDASWNIFDGFETSARKRESQLRQRRLERQLEAYRSELRAQAVNVVVQIGFLARQYQLDERRAALAEQTFSIQKREMDEGRVSAPVFRQQQVAVQESRLAELRMRVRLLLALNDYLDLTLPAVVDAQVDYSK